MVHAYRADDMWDVAANGQLKKLQQHIRARTSVHRAQHRVGGVDEPCAVSGWTALHFAAANGRFRAAKMLLEYGADIWTQTRSTGESAMHLAARNSQTRVVKLFLTCCDGLDEFVNDHDGNSVVHAACTSGNLDLVRVFFDRFSAQSLALLVEPGEFSEEIDDYLEEMLEGYL